MMMSCFSIPEQLYELSFPSSRASAISRSQAIACGRLTRSFATCPIAQFSARAVCSAQRRRPLSVPLLSVFFEDFFARKAFVSGVGFTLPAGLADSQMLDTAVKKSMIRSAEATVVVIDSSKIGYPAMAQVMGTQDVQTLLTDEGIADADRRAILDRGIDLQVAPIKAPE